jgi:hypothetical protein
MDGLSDDEGMRSTRSSIVHFADTEDAQEVIPAPQISQAGLAPLTQSNLASDFLEEPTKRLSTVTAETGILNPSHPAEKESEKPAQEFLSLTDQKAHNGKVAATPEVEAEEIEKPANGAPSVVSAAESKPATLTKESLPPQLSKVVMSYRTNEWAKHLSAADVPEPEELKLAEYPIETEEKVEVAAPVDVEELKQTVENTTQPPSRTASQMSNHPPALGRSSSAMSKTQHSPFPSRPETSNGEFSRSTSQLSIHGAPFQPTLNTRSMPFRSSSTPIISQAIVESPIEEESASSIPNLPRFASPNPYGNQSTLMGQRDTKLRSKSSLYLASPSTLSSTPEFPQSQFHSSAASQVGSDTGSLYGMVDDENMTLSQRRELIRQSSLQSSLVHQPPVPFDSHQPKRQSSAPHPLSREQQLASFRASVQNEFASGVPPRATIERQRSALWQEKQAEEQRRMLEQKMRGARDSAFDERMRKGDMLGAHREALRKMQAKANKNA